MNPRINSFKQPFVLIAGKCLGAMHSSLTQLEPFHEHRVVGQAKLITMVNIANGNLIIKDYSVELPDLGGAINFNHIYNSLNSAWKLSIARQIISLDKNKDITVIEPDGSEIQYQYNAQQQRYYAPAHAEGTPYLIYNELENSFLWYHPKTRVTEQFDLLGNITKRIA